MSGDNSIFGRDRPERGSTLHLVLDGVPLLSTAGASSEAELWAEVPRTRAGRRPRLALGAELDVSWGWRGKVRTRTYRVEEVLSSSSGNPQWRLEPVAASVEGTRRAVPRYTLALPAVLVAGGSRLFGVTVDLSVAGVRLAFPPASAQATALPADGTEGELALLLGQDRVAVPASVVRTAVLPDGTRDVRVFLTGPVDDERARLVEFVLAVAPPEEDVPAGPAPAGAAGTGQSNEEPVSAS